MKISGPATGIYTIWISLSARFRVLKGDFHTDLVRFRSNIDLTPDIAFTNSVQFDNVGEILGLYNRFRWTLRLGADLYLVHTWNWQRYDQRFAPIETEGTIKFSFTHRF